MMKKFYIFTLLVFSYNLLLAQPPKTIALEMPKVPAMRMLNHDYIDNNQRLIAKLDGIDDSLFIVTSIDSINSLINDALIVIVNNMQAKIELNKSVDDNSKYKWLRGLNDLLSSFISGYKARLIKGTLLYDIIKGYDEAMELDWQSSSIKPVIEKYDFEVGDIIAQNYALKNNAGAIASGDILLLKRIYRYPAKTMNLLSRNPQAYFADSIIISLAHKDPEQLYTYAAAPDALGRKIQATNEPLVKQIGILALMKTGRMYFPFLDDLYHHKIPMDSITKVLNDSTAYFKLLVKTQIEYADRAKNNDTPLVMKTLTDKLMSKAKEFYITEINALHDEKIEANRFKCLTPLSPQDLYYVAVLGEEEIYTSSYLGVYKRIFEKMKKPSADTLLTWIKYDHFKKFIKIAANYNTLDDFLKRMDKANAEKLMRNFVTGLESTKSLEDAVDVANSYASIYNEETRKLILDQIEKNLQQSEINKNKRGQTIYNLLSVIFNSMDSAQNIDVAARLGINGIYQMPVTELKDSAGKIAIQQFFYGDKDGKGVFNSFFKHYPAPLWKKVDKEQWVELSSTKGVPITIYCNKPLENETDEDGKAQKALGRYLESNNINPTVVIHRGHSYFVKSTIEQLPSSAKVILLGSCGGYQRLNDVLESCPGAHIISSKQTGTGDVNIALITEMTNTLRANKNLDWPLIWKTIAPLFKLESKEKFDDYVPPHKNLGAIFIMAYTIAMENASE